MRYKASFIIGMLILTCSCKKFLEKKSDISLSIPVTLNDFQQLLDNLDITDGATPGVLDLGADDYYFTDETFQSTTNTIARNCYTWEKDIFNSASVSDWNNPYQIIYKCNVVLEGLDNFEIANKSDSVLWNSIYGSALFIRSFELYQLEETFGQPFKPSSAHADLGIPLKLSANLSSVSNRSTVQQVYDRIIKDLKLAVRLLPQMTFAKNRPCKAAAYALLARISLTTQNYEDALVYADSSLQLQNQLIDYNTLPASSANPFSNYGPPNDQNFETIYSCFQVSYSIIRLTTTLIDTLLYNSYNDDDLRKVIFFGKNTSENTWYWKGNYSGSSLRQFSGLATDEMYITRAEAHARTGNKEAALADLNTLLKSRWKNTATYPEITAVDTEDALRQILIERRKELIFRGIRWSDLRRLNQDPRFSKVLIRLLNGQQITLAPEDRRYTYPIPITEIQFNHIPQNER